MRLKLLVKIFCACLVIVAIAYALVSFAETSIILNSSVKMFRALQILVEFGAVLTALFGMIVFAIGVKRIRIRRDNDRTAKKADSEIQSDPVKRLIYDIEKYLMENKSTALFKEKLEEMANQLPLIKKQTENAAEIVRQRFGLDSMSTNQFISPIEQLLDNLVRLGADLMKKLCMFDEERYQSKINELTKAGRTSEVTEYEEVLRHYINYATDIVSSFEKTVIRLDKLILEFAKLSSDELRSSIEGIQELDRVISNTKMYK